MEERCFTEEELKLLAMPLSERISIAIDQGEYALAKALAKQLEGECVPMIYTFEDFVTALLSFIGREQGDEVLQSALRSAAEVLMKPMFEELASLEFRARVEAFAAFFRAHSGKGLSIMEDEEKVTLVLNPCGSGGRMVQEGAFDPPRNLHRVQKAQGISFGRENFPCYCAHCAVFHHLTPIEWAGRPFPPIELGTGPGDPCQWHFYKDPADIPDKYFQQVGCRKG